METHQRPTPSVPTLVVGLMLSFALAASSLALVVPAPSAARTPGMTPAGAVEYPGAPALPSELMVFVENVGQFDAPARFQVRGSHSVLWLADDALWITVLERPSQDPSHESAGPALAGEQRTEVRTTNGASVRLSFVGANPHPRLQAFDRLDTHISFFTGDSPANWHADVPVWGGVRYAELYPGIDLEVSGPGGELQPRIIAGSGADLGAVRLRVEGADELALEGGHLRLTTPAGVFSLPLFQIVMADGSALPTSGERPVVSGNEIAAPFVAAMEAAVVPSQDSSNGLVYSTFLGGSDYEDGRAIAVDASGAAYVVGRTYSFDFPTTPGAFQRTYRGNEDAFVTKLNPFGSRPVYSTFLGGSSADEGYGIAVNASGEAYVSGRTASTDFPTTPGAFRTIYGGGPWDTFVTKLNATGSGLVFSTFLGGSGDDFGNLGTLDAAGVAYVSGYTTSSNFPVTLGAFQLTLHGLQDAFVTKLNADGSGLVYSTYLGGSGSEGGYGGIAVDASGAAYVTSLTDSSDFPITPGAFQTTHHGDFDAFVTKLNAGGSGLVFSTYLGGSDYDRGYGIAIDAGGTVYIGGGTGSPDFPITPGAFQTTCGCAHYVLDGFVTKMNANGSGLIYSTFIGGTDSDAVRAFALDASGATYVTGETYSTDYPTTSGAFQTVYGGGLADAFASKLSADGSALVYSTYLGRGGTEVSFGIALDANRRTYLTGFTDSSDFPVTPRAFQTVYRGGSDAFVTKLIMRNRPW